MNTMQPGEFNQRITFLARAPGQDALGQASGAWAPASAVPTVWAKSAGVSSRDIAAAGATQSTVDVKFITRYRADVQPTWRVQWLGRVFNIIGQPAPVSGGTEWMEIRCTAPLDD